MKQALAVMQDARVRYYALEALFNIAKVTREGFMPFFADTFEALFRLSADMDSAVHQATTYLDNLLKVCLMFLIRNTVEGDFSSVLNPHQPYHGTTIKPSSGLPVNAELNKNLD